MSVLVETHIIISGCRPANHLGKCCWWGTGGAATIATLHANHECVRPACTRRGHPRFSGHASTAHLCLDM